MSQVTTEDEIKNEVKKYQEMETKLLVLQSSLAKNKEFQQFLKLQKSVDDKAAEVWGDVESKMIKHGIKTIDAEWVKLTIVEKPKIDIIGDLAAKFMKRVPDTKKINEYIKKTQEAPEGVVQSKILYLRKTFRQVVS